VIEMRRMCGDRPLGNVMIMLVVAGFEVAVFGRLVTSVSRPGLAVGCLAAAVLLIEALRLVGIVAVAAATLRARDPRPVEVDPVLRVAFVTTIVPGKEPLAMVERTLRAALAVRHSGTYDVWLLDEGDDERVRAMCARIGARHFSRQGRPLDNQPAGAYRARTKHGNHNAWIREHGGGYDVLVSVDPDHVPRPGLGEHLLGYFRDPDVAFVVGPQVYGNAGELVPRWAQAQLELFHSLLQRAGNRLGAAMLVGTNNAIRLDALRSIGGVQDSVTEDLATGLALHGSRNPATGRRWRSVYVPTVVAVGEGPASWSDYFRQQHRWGLGADEVAVRSIFRTTRRLGPARALHYGLLMAYFPLSGLAWLVGAGVSVGSLILGAHLPAAVWPMLYADTAVYQWLFTWWNRRHAVLERARPGVTGMLIGTLSAPVHLASLIAAVLGQRAGFVVTPKGGAASSDRLPTFRLGLGWGAFFGVQMLVGAHVAGAGGALWLWPALNLAICLAPALIWSLRRRPAIDQTAVGEPAMNRA
jgi:hypothetical protein